MRLIYCEPTHELNYIRGAFIQHVINDNNAIVGKFVKLVPLNEGDRCHVRYKFFYHAIETLILHSIHQAYCYENEVKN